MLCKLSSSSQVCNDNLGSSNTILNFLANIITTKGPKVGEGPGDWEQRRESQRDETRLSRQTFFFLLIWTKPKPYYGLLTVHCYISPEKVTRLLLNMVYQAFSSPIFFFFASPRNVFQVQVLPMDNSLGGGGAGPNFFFKNVKSYFSGFFSFFGGKGILLEVFFLRKIFKAKYLSPTPN